MTKAELVEKAATEAKISKVAAAAAQGHSGWFRHILKSTS